MIRLITLLALLASSTAYAATSTAITIWSDGVRLAGDLWQPDGLAPGERRPAILMVHGWGGTKAHLNQAYAPRFADMGYLVLTFDYRGWGESDGKLVRTLPRSADVPESSPERDSNVAVTEVRQIVDPIDQLEDIENAYYYLIGEPAVDAERLAIWGSSLGGGLALQSAATLPGFKVLISQIGAVNPQSQQAMSDSDIRRWRTARARGDVPPFPGEDAAVPGLTGNPDWPEYVRYDPYASRTQLTSATLIIDAENEELFDISENGAALYAAIKDQVPARYEALPGKHYDIYRDSGYRAAVELQMAWLKTHLPLTE